MSEHDQILEMLAAYALGSLDEPERDATERHLAICDDCRIELVAYQAVADHLGYAVPTAPPPAALKGKVMAAILSSREPVQPAQPQGGFLAPLRSLSYVWSLVGLTAILVLLASNLLLWRQVNQLQETNRLLQEVVRTDFQTVAMVGTSAAPEASGMIIISPDGKHGTMVVEQLPALDPDHQYQLWLIKDGERTSGGVFSVGEDGYKSVYVDSPLPLVSYSGFGVTVEPTGGSPGPTGEKVLGNQS